MKKFYHQFWIQIAAGLIVLIAFLGFLIINASGRTLRSSVLNERKEIVARAAGEVKLFLQYPEGLLNSTASVLGILYSNIWQQESVLVELALNQPIFMRASFFDLSGKVIASSELGKVIAINNDESSMRQALKGKTYISEVKFNDNRIPYLVMMVPVKVKGKANGVLAADINLRGLWEMVDNIRLGKTGRAFMVSGNGTLIAHQDKKRVLKNENLKFDKDVFGVIHGKGGAIEFGDAQGRQWVSSYTPIDGFGGGIVLRQQRQEAYLSSGIMKTQSWIIIILSEILAVLIGVIMARAFASPIKLLISGIKSALSGNLGDRIKIKRHDEIGELIKVFNELTDKLKQARANEKFSDIREAALWAAHELKNSLVPIKSFVQLFPAKRNDQKFVDKFNNLVPEEINYLECMLKDLSDLSGYSVLSREQTDIKSIMNSVLKIMEDKFSESKIKVQYYVNNNNFHIMADAKRIKQVFINLIINAVNAMPQGGKLTVSLDKTDASDINLPFYILINISDTGVGFSGDRLNGIFEPFKTTNKSGMGLGLAICRRIVKQHNGDIRAESRMGVGTTFTVKLPFEKDKIILNGTNSH